MEENQPTAGRSDARLVRPFGSEGLEFSAARNVEEVAGAWSLVYRAYRRLALIDPNPYRVWAPRGAASPRSAVFYGRIGPIIVSTVTAVIDDGSSLPMQSPFEPEIELLRREGCRLVEAVLFADRREQLERISASLLTLVRMVYRFGRWSGATDVVAAVQPGDAPFFERLFTFRALGPARPCPEQLHKPAVPMRCNLAELSDYLASHPTLGSVVGEEVATAMFEHRFGFEAATLSTHMLGEYLDGKHRQCVSAAG
jgi:hypothetical protein